MELNKYDFPPDCWNEFVENHPNGRLYHLSQWNELIRSTFGHSIVYFVLKNEKGLGGILPLTEFKTLLFGKFSVSLPFINYGGPLISDTKYYPDVFNYLEEYRESSNFDFIELRMDSFFETKLPYKKHKVTFVKKLPNDSEILMDSFNSKLRSQIRRPSKEGMYSKSGLVDLVGDFYKVYSVNMRDLGTPALPKSFFRNVLDKFPQNASIICVYSREGKPVAVSFLIIYKNICEIPWASSLREYNKFSPNMLLYWESFKYAIERGCFQFDMGRCTPDTGTYRFKRQWDAEEKQLYWYYAIPDFETLPELNPNNPKFNLLIKTWQKLPVMITNSISPLIIKNIP